MAVQPTSTRFNVVSIHQSRPGTPRGMSWSYTPDGYHARGQSLWQTIMIAYYPLSWKYWQGNSVKNAPSWLEGNKYAD